MTVVEIALAAAGIVKSSTISKGQGTYYAAHFPADSEVGYYQRSLIGKERSPLTLISVKHH